VTPDGFKVKEAAAAVVRQIYAMACDGLGVDRITGRLTRDGVPPIGNGDRWVKPYVYRILTSPAAMGTYQPQRQEGKKSVDDGPPIPNFYPAVVSEEGWQDAQDAIEGRAGGRGAGRKGGEETNLFTGLLRCALTGGNLNIVHALGRPGPEGRKRYVYLAPTRENGVPAGGRIDYAVFEAAVLSLLKEVTPADIAPEGKHANGRKAEIARLSGRLLDIDNRLERTRQRARTAGDFDAFLDLIAELQAERKQVIERRAELEQEEDGRSSADLGEAQSLIGMLEGAAPEQREDLRRRLKGRIRQLVTGGWVVIVRQGRRAVCGLQFWFRGGRRRDYAILHKAGSRYTAEQWWARSLSTAAAPGDLDLRKRADAEKLEALLSVLDFDALAGDGDCKGRRCRQ
jgi:hypothetical protein